MPQETNKQGSTRFSDGGKCNLTDGKKDAQKRFKMPNGRYTQDMRGERFGKLLVVGFGEYRRTEKRTSILWKCKCDCGNECLADASGLRRGDRISCGCAKREHISKLQEKAYNLQLCWTCKKACGGYGCPWAVKHNPQPVPGWKAKKTRVKSGKYDNVTRDVVSYAIKECPLYEWDGKGEKHE